MHEKESVVAMPQEFGQNALRKPEILDEEFYNDSKEYVTLLVRGARDAFLQDSGGERGRLAYVPQFDFAPYSVLLAHQNEIHPRVYEEALQALRAETEFHVTTLLGEMFGAQLSRYNYRIFNRQIYSQFSMAEPFLKVMERGQIVREKGGSKVVEREKAELKGFKHIQDVLCDEQTPVGTMMVSFSPPDEVYPHRFADIHTLMAGKDGKRFIESRRYASVLGNQEFAEKVAEYDSRYAGGVVPTAAEFLANPIEFRAGKTPFSHPDQLHKYFQEGYGGGMTEDEFKNVVLPAHRGYIKRYMERLEAPNMNDMQRLEAFKALLVFAQQFPEYRKRQEETAGVVFDATIGGLPSDKQISMLAMQQLNGMSLPCGDLFGSGGAVAAYGGAFGVAAAGGFGYGSTASFESDQYGPLDFLCPNGGCAKKNKRPAGRLISNCDYCGADVSCK